MKYSTFIGHMFYFWSIYSLPKLSMTVMTLMTLMSAVSSIGDRGGFACIGDCEGFECSHQTFAKKSLTIIFKISKTTQNSV